MIYNRLTGHAQAESKYVSELKDLQSKWFKLIQMFVLIATNRTKGYEQKQLRWKMYE